MPQRKELKCPSCGAINGLERPVCRSCGGPLTPSKDTIDVNGLLSDVSDLMSDLAEDAPAPKILPEAAPMLKIRPAAAPAPKSEAGAAPAPKSEAGATPAPKSEAGATPAPKSEAGATPAPKSEAGATPAPSVQPAVPQVPKVQLGAAPEAPVQPKAAPAPQLQQSAAPAVAPVAAAAVRQARGEEKPPSDKAKAGGGETFMCMVCGTKVPSDANKCRICGTIFLDEAKVGTVRGLPVAKVSHPLQKAEGAGEPRPVAAPLVPPASGEPPAPERALADEPVPEEELPTMQFVSHRRAPLKKKHETKKS